MLRNVYQTYPKRMMVGYIRIYGNIIKCIMIYINILKIHENISRRSNPKVVEWDPVAEEWTVRISVLPKLPSSSSPSSSSSLSLSESSSSPLEFLSSSYNHYLDR